MKIVVTGAGGGLGRAFLAVAGAHHDVIPLMHDDLDIGDHHAVLGGIPPLGPDLIVNCAAFTKVDANETDQPRAFRDNAQGPQSLALAARMSGARLLHVSTDYVFDGLKPSPYLEDDPTHPNGVYGASKMAGEQAVLAAHANSVILRTAWVYSPFGANFVKTMLRLAIDREAISVVADQHGNPSNALDIADGIISVARNLVTSEDPAQRGIFHMAGAGEASWADFAEGIFASSLACGGPTAMVRRIATSDYPTLAKRPANSRLDCGKIARVHGVELPNWHNSVDRVVRKLVQSAE